MSNVRFHITISLEFKWIGIDPRCWIVDSMKPTKDIKPDPAPLEQYMFTNRAQDSCSTRCSKSGWVSIPAIAAMLCLLASCNAAGHFADSPNTSGTAPPIQRSLPSPATLDELGPIALHVPGSQQAARTVSSKSEFNSPGNLVLAASEAAIVLSDGTATISAAKGRVEWLIYEAVNCNSRALSVNLDILLIKQDFYVAVPDYASGRWKLDGPRAAEVGATLIELDNADYVSPRHRQFFAVLAVDGAALRVNSFTATLTNVNADFQPAAADALSRVSLLDLQGRPGIAYAAQTEDGTGTCFLTADGGNPLDPGDWVKSVIASTGAPISLDAVMHDGRPYVLFCNAIGNLSLARSKVPRPQSDSDWEVQELIGDRFISYAALVSDGQNLHIACFNADLTDADLDGFYAYLEYGRSLSADGMGAWEIGRLSGLGNADGTDYSEPDIAIVDGTPAVAITNYYEGADSTLLFCQANNSAPVVENDDWQLQELQPGGAIQGMCIREIDGRPWIMYRDLRPMCWIGLQARPAGQADWKQEQIFYWPAHPSIDMLNLNERPLTAYSLYPSPGVFDSLTYIQSWGPGLTTDQKYYNFHHSLAAGGQVLEETAFVSLAFVGGVPALAHVDTFSGQLQYARIELP